MPCGVSCVRCRRCLERGCRTFLFNDKDIHIIRLIETNNVQIQSRQSRGSTRGRDLGAYTVVACPYYSPYYSKPSELVDDKSIDMSHGSEIFLATAAGYRDDPTHASVLDGPVSRMSYAQTNDSTHTGHGIQPPRIRSAFPTRAWSLSDPTAIVALARG